MEEECPLPEKVEALINIICNEQSQPPLSSTARLELASVGEVVALKILNKLRKLKINSFSAYAIWMARESKKSQAPSSSQNLSGSPSTPTASQLASLSSVSPPSVSHSQGSGSSSSTSLRRDRNPTSKSNKRRDGSSVLSFLSDRVASIKLNLFNSSNLPKPTPEFLALEKLGFRRAFLVLSYLGGRKLEDEVSVGEIRSLVAECRHLTMGSFESLLWDRYGDRYCLRKDRIKVHVI